VITESAFHRRTKKGGIVFNGKFIEFQRLPSDKSGNKHQEVDFGT
jgi:hypothetical protein